MIGSGKYFLILSTLSRAYSLIASVASICLKVTENCIACASLKNLLALRARQDAELLAVLGHRAPRDVDVLVPQELHDLLIRMRVLGVLGGDDRLDLVL